MSLLGVPGIQMGFNEHLGWAHTFSKGHRFCAYQLRLEPGEPTVYRYGDTTREMTSSEHTVTVLGDAGDRVEVTRELWRTHHGPMLNLPLLGWGLETAFSYRDANADNTTVLEQFLSMARARDVGELRRVFHDLRGMPWVNTMAADSSGDIYYCDASATPSLSEAATSRFLRRLDEDLVAALAFDNRIAMLDGSDPDDDWVEHPGARSPGLEPPDRLPEMTARDLVVNANDSHWLSHPHRTLEGYPVLCGLERTPRSLRTRQNLLVAEQLAERGEVGTDDVAAALFDNASLSGALLRDAVVQRCREAGSIELRGVTVDLWAAADVLERWDLSAGLDAVGVVLWREFMAGFSDADWRAGGSLFAVPFDPADPVDTPNGLAPPPTDGHDPVLLAVAAAVVDLADAGLDIDTPLGEVQWAARGERARPGARRRRSGGDDQRARPDRRAGVRVARADRARPAARGRARPHRPRCRRLPGHLRNQLRDDRRVHPRGTQRHGTAGVRPERRRPLPAPRRRHRGLRRTAAAAAALRRRSDRGRPRAGPGAAERTSMGPRWPRSVTAS